MRVVLIALSVGGAMGQYVNDLASSLKDRVELHLFTPAHYEHTESFQGLHTFNLGASRTQRLFHLLNIMEASRVWEHVEALHPDVIHLFNGEGYPWGLFFAWRSKATHIPFAVTLHDPDPHPGNLWEALNARLRGFTLKQASAVHIHTRQFEPLLLKQGIDERVIHIIPHGSLATRFLRHKVDGIQREPMALFFGRLEGYKGLDIFVEIGLRFEGQIRFVIAGPGNVEPKILEKIRAHPRIFDLQNRFIDDQEVALLFQRASVCVLPYTHVTQSSLPLIAAAFDVPVVASALGGFLEDVPRVNGVLVSPGNVDGFVVGIREALRRRPVYPRDLDFDVLSERFTDMYNAVSY